MIALTRRYRFAAAHVLRRPDWGDAENERVYGKCANPNGHGHSYGLEVTVTGPVDRETGRVVEPARLDALVRAHALEGLADRYLNDQPAFRELVPTAENIALVVQAALEEPIAEETGARLLRVRVEETRRNHFECGEPE